MTLKTTITILMMMVVSTLMFNDTGVNNIKQKDMEQYPEQIQESVNLLKQMQQNSQEFNMWKNISLARKVINLLEDIPDRGEYHTPYDKIFLLNILCENISCSDNPRFTLSVLTRMLELFNVVQLADYKDYDERIERKRIENSYQKWTDYIDIENVKEDEWRKKYSRYLRFDPIERTEKWEAMNEQIEAEIDAEIDPDMPRGMGFCHYYWSLKKTVLQRHGINWQSPAVMNPGVLFD